MKMFRFRNKSCMIPAQKLLLMCCCVGIILYLIHMNREQREVNNLHKNKLYERKNMEKHVEDIKRIERINVIAEIEKRNEERINVTAEIEKLNEEKVPADDPRLVQLIKRHFIKPPSKRPYNLVNPSKMDTSRGQAPFVDNRLRFKEGGFYVESGAHNGEFLSNTLFFERTRHWNGILIEPLPDVFKALQKKHRKAYSLNACLSPHPYPSKEYLSNTPVVGKIERNDSRENTVHVQCFPLYSVLLALNRTSVDFLSLDIEGVEHSVLETLPWNKVNITMLAVEFGQWLGGSKALCKFMENKGYKCAMNLWAPGAADTLFQKQQ